MTWETLFELEDSCPWQCDRAHGIFLLFLVPCPGHQRCWNAVLRADPACIDRKKARIKDCGVRSERCVMSRIHLFAQDLRLVVLRQYRNLPRAPRPPTLQQPQIRQRNDRTAQRHTASREQNHRLVPSHAVVADGDVAVPQESATDGS